MKKPLGLRLEESLVERIDVVRGGVSRAAWIEAAIEARLGGSPGPVVRAVAQDVEVRRPARSVHPRVVSSAGAKVGVVPVWRGTDGSE